MRTLGIAVAVVAGLTLTACSSSGKHSASSSPAGGSSSSAGSSLDTAAAQAQVTRNWEAFFSKDTPLATKLTYLQNGTAMRAAVEQFGKDPRTKQAKALVTSVAVSSATAATVNYQVLLNGTVALPSAVGNAVYEDGTWKVSDRTLCGLLGLMGSTHIPGC